MAVTGNSVASGAGESNGATAEVESNGADAVGVSNVGTEAQAGRSSSGQAGHTCGESTASTGEVLWMRVPSWSVELHARMGWHLMKLGQRIRRTNSARPTCMVCTLRDVIRS
ncbi:hypothetical protein PIB30_066716 [Stylosanthes scabra]|uniref:Uncharacterized protein n=1 Tax=Stylosanthes scabra TaxID=79078 RepID=A0ABU6XNU9_9FABA|nr:hypothetical protein [Stylosanthes scabra]